MTYIENIFVCVAAPLVITALCMGKKYLSFFVFMLEGMDVSAFGVCEYLCSGFVSNDCFSCHGRNCTGGGRSDEAVAFDGFICLYLNPNQIKSKTLSSPLPQDLLLLKIFVI